MLQVPEATNVAVVPDTVQTAVLLEAKLTASPEVAVAFKLSGVPTCCALIVPKVMVCALGAAFTVKLCVTGVAAEYVVLPACEAVMLQVPGATNVTALPDTVQTPVVVEAKLTVKPEVAVAESVSGVPTVCAAIAPNVIVCACRTVIFCDTGVAAA